MTGDKFKSILGVRLEDTAESIFTSAVKMDAINIAQRTIVSMINRGYLTELQTVKEDQSLSSGSITFSSAGITPIENGIIGVYNESNDKFCNIVEPTEVINLDNSYLAGTESSPIAYVFNSTIYVKPTTISIVDIWYLKTPTDYDSTNATSMATECELSIGLHGIILDLAESELLRQDAQLDRANFAYTNAINLIKVLNDRYMSDKSNNIGVVGR